MSHYYSQGTVNKLCMELGGESARPRQRLKPVRQGPRPSVEVNPLVTARALGVWRRCVVGPLAPHSACRCYRGRGNSGGGRKSGQDEGQWCCCCQRRRYGSQRHAMEAVVGRGGCHGGASPRRRRAGVKGGGAVRGPGRGSLLEATGRQERATSATSTIGWAGGRGGESGGCHDAGGHLHDSQVPASEPSHIQRCRTHDHGLLSPSPAFHHRFYIGIHFRCPHGAWPGHAKCGRI